MSFREIYSFSPFLALYSVILAFVTGACMGSGLNCIFFRLREKASLFARSRCPHCGHTLGLRDLFPLFSYIFLRGKCRFCREKIASRYLFIELAFALCYTGLFCTLGVSRRLLEYILLFTLLLLSSLSDITTMEVPDLFPLLEAGVFALFLLTYPHPLERLLWGLLSALVYGGGILLLSLLADKVYKKESFGGADIKLIAVLGLYFGMKEMLFLVIISAIIGIIFACAAKAGLAEEFPFIPSLTAGAFITLLWGEKFITWYLHLFNLHNH